MQAYAQGNEKTQGSLLVHAPLSAAVYFIYDSDGNSGGAAQLYFFLYADRAGVYRCFLLSFFFAWLINELSHNMRVFFTIIFYAPSISGGIYIIWNYLFSGDAQGYVNSILRKLGIIQTPIQFFQNPDYMFPILIVIILWMSLGTSFLVFIAGFQGVDKQYYEAAALDGISNRWQELWYVTLPMMKPQLLLSAVLSITGSFGVGDVITNLCGFPSTNYAVHTIMNHLSDYGTTRYEMGYACTLATILFLMMIFCNSVIRKLLKSVGT